MIRRARVAIAYIKKMYVKILKIVVDIRVFRATTLVSIIAAYVFLPIGYLIATIGLFNLLNRWIE